MLIARPGGISRVLHPKPNHLAATVISLFCLMILPPPAMGQFLGGPEELLVDGFEDFDGACPQPVVPVRDTSLTEYNDLLFVDWPGPNGDAVNIAVNNGEYMALEFTVPNTPESGALSTVQAPVPNVGGLIMSIDRCPGVLQTTDGACDVNFPAVKANTNWRHSTSIAPVGCILDVGQIYFVNIFFGDRDGNSVCNFDECVTRLRNLF